MIVRLKDTPTHTKKTTGPGFNSMIVRLKATSPTQYFGYSIKFQFYDSPIKRRKRVGKGGTSCEFQFYDSPIKRDTTRRVSSRSSGVSIL